MTRKSFLSSLFLAPLSLFAKPTEINNLSTVTHLENYSLELAKILQICASRADEARVPLGKVIYIADILLKETSLNGNIIGNHLKEIFLNSIRTDNIANLLIPRSCHSNFNVHCIGYEKLLYFSFFSQNSDNQLDKKYLLYNLGSFNNLEITAIFLKNFWRPDSIYLTTQD